MTENPETEHPEGAWPDIMVDIETTGTRPDRAAILQIAAVKFDIRTGDASPDFFDKCLTIPRSRGWDEDTRNWWLKDKQPLLMSLIARGEPYRQVLTDFRDWCGPNAGRFWCRGLSFDFPFVASYFNDYEVSNPFKFWQAMDTRTWIEAKDIDQNEFEFKGTEHNALHDVIHEIKVVTNSK